ncbi:MAG: TIGR03435 family protein [Bryobacteraceae bacterium]
MKLVPMVLSSVVSFLSGLAWPQTVPIEQTHQFDSAVIKASDPTSSDVWLVPESGGLRAQNVVVWQLIKAAYYVRDEQLVGGPAWVKSERYDILASPLEREALTLSGAMTPSQAGDYLARHRQRLQALLRDRFALSLKTESRVKRFYVLKQADGGVRMPLAGDRDGGPVARMRNGQLSVTTDAKGIASLLADVLGATVLDETGLTGQYRVNLEWSPEMEQAASIAAAAKDQLGLELESRTGPLPVYVIDRIARPSENLNAPRHPPRSSPPPQPGSGPAR